MQKPENRRALALVRANPDSVYAQDSAGTIFASAVAHFEKIPDNEREVVLKSFGDYCVNFLRVGNTDSSRLKRILKQPVLREAMTILTKTQWGRDLFSSNRVEKLGAARVSEVGENNHRFYP